MHNEGWFHVTSSAKRLLWGDWLNCLLLINPFISSFWSSFLNEHGNLKPALFLGVFPANVMVTLSHVIQWQVFAIAKTTRLVTTVRHAKKVSMEIQLKAPKMTANHVLANMALVAFWSATTLFAQIVLKDIQGISVSTVKMVTMVTHQAF